MSKPVRGRRRNTITFHVKRPPKQFPTGRWRPIVNFKNNTSASGVLKWGLGLAKTRSKYTWAMRCLAYHLGRESLCTGEKNGHIYWIGEAVGNFWIFVCGRIEMMRIVLQGCGFDSVCRILRILVEEEQIMVRLFASNPRNGWINLSAIQQFCKCLNRQGHHDAHCVGMNDKTSFVVFWSHGHVYLASAGKRKKGGDIRKGGLE